jgi:hypothetical protein
MSDDDPIHLYERPKFRNFCGARQWTPTPSSGHQYLSSYNSMTGRMNPTTVKRDKVRTDAFPRARNAKVASECNGEPHVAAVITICYLTAEEGVLIPVEKLCPACHLFWTVMQANGLKTKAETRRLMQKALEEKPK